MIPKNKFDKNPCFFFIVQMKIMLIILICLLPIVVYSNDYALYYTINDSLSIGLMGVPFASYSSEFGGSVGVSLHIFEKNLSKSIRSGYLYGMRIQAEYSESSERELTFEGSIPFRRINQLVEFELSGMKKPKLYYGIGGSSDRSQEYSYTYIHYRFLGSWIRSIFRNLDAGITWDFSNYRNTDLDTAVTYPDIPGFYNQYNAIGLGTNLVYNTKHPNNFPTSGYYYLNQILLYDDMISSDYNFITIKQEFQYFHSIKNHVIANQILSINTFNEVPFHYYPVQGGSRLMRGLSTGRYIDKQFLGGQTEYRSPFLFWRISGVSFLSGAISYRGLNDFKKDYFHITGGVGIRFAIDKSERVNGRFDIGISEDGWQVYLKFGEVF